MIEAFETVAKAVADQSRLRILKLLEGGELCVCQITAVIALAPATVSKHLAVLRAAGLLQQRRDGKWIYYRLAGRPAGGPATPYAPAMLALVQGALADDGTIAADRQRLATVKETPIGTLCAKDTGRDAVLAREALVAVNGEGLRHVDHHLP